MAQGLNGVVLRQIHALFGAGSVAGLSDAELLERFVGGRGEAAESAFSALVERHGPMVWRVCRRVLAGSHDAEDAFQATFLVLARKAGSIRKGDSVGCWLHGVALRVSACAKASAARRRRHELQGAEMKPRPVGDGGDLGPILHEEIGRLPERFRAPVVLCCLEGLTHDEAAHQLGWPVGTVKSRLARGRERLRDRLTRLGLAPSLAALTAALAAESAPAAVPPRLAEATVRAALSYAAGGAATAGVVSASAAAWAEGALTMVMLTRWKVAASALVAFALVAAGAGVTAQQPPPAVPAPEDNGRLEQMERKIDRLLQALEGGPRDMAKASSRPRAEAHTLHRPFTETPKEPRSIDDRLSDVENRLSQVEAKLKRFEEVLRRDPFDHPALAPPTGLPAPARVLPPSTTTIEATPAPSIEAAPSVAPVSPARPIPATSTPAPAAPTTVPAPRGTP